MATRKRAIAMHVVGFAVPILFLALAAVQPSISEAARVAPADAADSNLEQNATKKEPAGYRANDSAVANVGERDDAEAAAQLLASRQLIIPVAGTSRASLRDTFAERRGTKAHGAIDIAAPRGTPVVATDEGRVVKLYTSSLGGLTVYQFDRDAKFAYYYAHLDGYADGLREGMILKRGELIGYVGSTGNAPPHAPHLHFAIYRLTPDKRWWQGSPVNPYPLLNDATR